MPLSIFLTSCRILFKKLIIAHLVTIFPLSYCIVRSSNISTLASRLTPFCGRLIRFMSCHTAIRFNIVLVSVTSFQILLLQFCINFFSFSSRDSSVGIPVWGSLLQNVWPGCWSHSASYSMDTGVKPSDRKVYHSSPLSAKVDE